MGILSNRGRDLQQRSSTQPECEHINSECNPNSREHRYTNRNSNKFLRFLGFEQRRKLHNIRSNKRVSVHSELSRSWDDKSNNNSKSNVNRIRDRHYLYFHPIKKYASKVLVGSLSLLVSGPVYAEGVGGVSATANPIANSSGSVTNQAIQVLQGPYITNTYGNQISCQGATANFTPYIQFSDSRKDPWIDFYNEPQYDMTDFTGRTTTQTVTVKNYPWESWYDDRTHDVDGVETRWFEDGADIQIEMDIDGPDGIPDNPGDVSWLKPVRTDMSANQSFNVGLSATLSWPLDGKLQALCKKAAETQIAQQQQLTANKRLDFEIARLKNCGELKKQGIFFHPASPYHAICADVVVTNPGGQLVPHRHNLPKPTSSLPSATPSQPGSVPVAPTSAPLKTEQDLSSQEATSLLRLPSSQSVLPSSKGDQPAALLGGPMSRRLPQLSQ